MTRLDFAGNTTPPTVVRQRQFQIDQRLRPSTCHFAPTPSLTRKHPTLQPSPKSRFVSITGPHQTDLRHPKPPRPRCTRLLCPLATTEIRLPNSRSSHHITHLGNMVSTKKRSVAELEDSNGSQDVSLLDRIRNMWQFANLSQWIYMFGKAVRIPEDIDVEVRSYWTQT